MSRKEGEPPQTKLDLQRWPERAMAQSHVTAMSWEMCVAKDVLGNSRRKKQRISFLCVCLCCGRKVAIITLLSFSFMNKYACAIYVFLLL